MNTPNSADARHLAWSACYNTRDLGGLPTQDGGVTRWRSIIRSDLLNRLDEQGRKAMIDYGVRTIIDIRWPEEAQVDPSPFADPAMSAGQITYRLVPLEVRLPHVSALMDAAESRAEVYCIALDHHISGYARVMRAIIDAPEGGIVLHCNSGKDRTGVVSAVLLSLAGVTPEAVAADYVASQERLWPLYEKLVADTGGEDRVAPWMKPICTPETMLEVLEHLAAQYGGPRGYLRAAGLTPQEIDRLAARLRDHTP